MLTRWSICSGIACFGGTGVLVLVLGTPNLVHSGNSPSTPGTPSQNTLNWNDPAPADPTGGTSNSDPTGGTANTDLVSNNDPSGGTTSAPEIDPAGLASMASLVVGGLALITARRRKS